MTVRIARLEPDRAIPSGDGPRPQPSKAGDRGDSGDLEVESGRPAEPPAFARDNVEEAPAGAEADLPPDEAPIAAEINGPVSSTAADATGARHLRILALALEDSAVMGIMERFGARIVEIKEVP